MGQALFPNGTTQPTPSAGYITIYSKTSDKRVYILDELGNETCLVDQGKLRNYVINGGADVFQRVSPTDGSVGTGVTAPANNTYAADRFVLLTNGSAGDITVAQVAGPTTPIPSRFAFQYKQTNAAAKNIGCVQWLEAVDSIPLRGRKVTFQLNNINATNIRMAIIGWTGTADTLGGNRDPVNAWANSADADPTATFFKTTGGAQVYGYTAASSATGILSVTATIGASANNVAVVVWIAGTVAQNVTEQFGQLMLTDGMIQRDWFSLGQQQDLARCQRMYSKTFALATKPGQNVGANTGEIQQIAGKAGAGAEFLQWRFPVAMRAAPTITTFNPAVANAQTHDQTASVDCSATTAVYQTEQTTLISMTGNGSTAVGNLLQLHLTADAEL